MENDTTQFLHKIKIIYNYLVFLYAKFDSKYIAL